MAEQVWSGAQALEQYLVPINELDESEENARLGDIMALVGSLQRFGQVRAIATTPEGKIVAGHHLRKAALELGWTHIAAVPNQFADDEERQAFLFADNHLASLGGYDEQKRAEQLTFLDDMMSQGRLEGTGIDADGLDDLRAAMGTVAQTTYEGEWEGGYGEEAQAQAQRAAELAASQRMREIVLMVTEEDHQRFGEWVRALQKRYGTVSVVETVLRAVQESADLVPDAA